MRFCWLVASSDSARVTSSGAIVPISSCTMAPLDVTRAESELATNQQNLIVAQTVQLTDEQTLKNAITRNPLDPKVVNVEIIPTDKPAAPAQTEAPSFEEALKEAYAKRPDLLEQVYNLKNAALDEIGRAHV